MPYVESEGVRIHYQVEGAGSALVLQHGVTDSLASWYEFGYVSALATDYKLILLDARGHGGSDKPHEPVAYEPSLFVGDILAVLDQLHIAKAHFWGYSMGGRIGFAAAKYAPERFSSFIIGGAHPYREGREALTPWLQELRKGAGAIATLWEVPLSRALQARLLTNDMDAIVAYWRQRMESPGFEEVLPTLPMPCLLYAGEADGRYANAKGCATHIPNATFVSLPGLKHAEGFFRSDLVLPHVTRVLGTVLAP
jgi:pimeloyl-ACP methyl ester carboxylesterase